MVTALVDREQRNLGIDAGANDYLTKPIDRRDVLLRVRNAVYAKRLHDKVQHDLEQLRELELLRDAGATIVQIVPSATSSGIST